MKKVLGKMSSRKFVVLIIATVAFFLSKLDSKEWIIVACIYIGGNVFKQMVELLKELIKSKRVIGEKE